MFCRDLITYSLSLAREADRQHVARLKILATRRTAVVPQPVNVQCGTAVFTHCTYSIKPLRAFFRVIRREYRHEVFTSPPPKPRQKSSVNPFFKDALVLSVSSFGISDAKTGSTQLSCYYIYQYTASLSINMRISCRDSHFVLTFCFILCTIRNKR